MRRLPCDSKTVSRPCASCARAQGPPSSSSAQAIRVREVTAALQAPPASLYFDRGQVPIPAELDNAFGKLLMQLMGFYSKKSQLLHGAVRRGAVRFLSAVCLCGSLDSLYAAAVGCVQVCTGRQVQLHKAGGGG